MTPTTVVFTSESVISRPTTPGSAAKRRRHSGSLRTAVAAAPGRLSSARSVRPSSGCMRSTRKYSGATTEPVRRSGSPDPLRSKAQLRSSSAISSKLWLCARQSTPSSRETSPSRVMKLSRSGSGNGSGRNTTASTTLKIAELAPTPSASVSSATAAKPGLLASWRSASRTSWSSVSKGSSSGPQRHGWVDGSGPARGDQVRQQRGGPEHHRRQPEREGVGGPDPEQHVRHQPRQRERHREARREADHHDEHALPHHQRQDVDPAGAERHADADLALPLPDQEGHHAVDPDRGQQQRQSA